MSTPFAPPDLLIDYSGYLVADYDDAILSYYATPTIPRAGDLIDLILYRIRATGGFSYSQDFAVQILSLAQALAQASMKRILKNVDFTLVPEKPVYDTTTEFGDCYQITCIEDERIHLSEAKDWRELSRVNSYWLRTHAQKARMFAQIGTHFLAVTPSPLSPRTVQVTYVKETAELENVDSEMELPAEDLSFCADLAEVVLLLGTARGGKLSEVASKIQQFMQRAKNVQDRVKNERDI